MIGAPEARATYQPGAWPAWLDDPTTPPRACQGTDPDDWFTTRLDEIRLLRRICDRCPALDICRTWALSRPRDELHGVWGGTSRYDRLRMTRPTA